MITPEQIKEMIQLEVRRILFEDVTLQYDSPHWMNDNCLRIELLLNEEVITSMSLSQFDMPQVK